MRKLEAIEGSRGFAAVMIALYHMPELNDLFFIKFSYLFVDFFFVLSGFLIATIYIDELSSKKLIIDFFVKRLARLWPMMIFAWILYLAVLNIIGFIDNKNFILVHPTLFEIASQISMFYGLGLGDGNIYNFPSWSISVEFLVYIIFGFVLLFFKDKYKYFIFFVLMSVSYIFMLYVDGIQNECGFIKYGKCMDRVASIGGLVRCLIGFFLGCTITLIKTKYKINAKISINKMTIMSCGSVFFLLSLMELNSYLAFLAPLVFSIFVFSISFDVGLIHKFLSSKIMQFLGRISYSIYLLHLTILMILDKIWIYDSISFKIITYLFILIISSKVTFEYIEKKFKIIMLKNYSKFFCT
ncbi:acyltransferase [Limnohabitans sp. Jir72]|uniref:acyltransferase family protein n=1 Tax=Limnohabitans sp. Jir72 TaxID=1977909 RepID=UPI000D37C933|nr:acyltransferase [Limnohabitans sp. Jir72]PUE28095.1 hypothetical protein B9Z52_14565 [Limnohabitans sp. Jir72]